VRNSSDEIMMKDVDDKFEKNKKYGFKTSKKP
jgi:hypothetical protein